MKTIQLIEYEPEDINLSGSQPDPLHLALASSLVLAWSKAHEEQVEPPETLSETERVVKSAVAHFLTTLGTLGFTVTTTDGPVTATEVMARLTPTMTVAASRVIN